MNSNVYLKKIPGYAIQLELRRDQKKQIPIRKILRQFYTIITIIDSKL